MNRRILGACMAVCVLAACSGTRPDAPVAEEATPEEAGPREWTSPNGAEYVLRRSSDEESVCHPVEEAGEEEVSEAGTTDEFVGVARARVKTSIASAQSESFDDIDSLIATFEAALPDAPDTKRAAAEKRNVTVRGWIWAAKKETDNDFHVILGSDPDGSTPTFLNVEVSGLPASGTHRARLAKLRDEYKDFFDGAMPKSGYDTYNPPIPVTMSGSLFYDTEHELHEGRCSPVGTGLCHPCTAWEIHPVTAIEFLDGE